MPGLATILDATPLKNSPTNSALPRPAVATEAAVLARSMPTSSIP
jgi:hypothetical protein